MSHLDRLPIDHSAPVGTRVSGTACVVRCDERTTRRGDPWIRVELRHSRGRIGAAVWKESVGDWRGVSPGDAVRVEGVLKEAHGDANARDLRISQVRRLNPDHPIRLEMNPESPISESQLRERYEVLKADMRYSTVVIVEAVLEGEFELDYWSAPAAAKYHHAYIRGLPEHSIEVATFGQSMVRACNGSEWLDEDLVIAGGLLHDLGKIREYRWVGCPIEYRPGLSSHVCMGQMMLAKAVREGVPINQLTDTDRRFIRLLMHMIESHHGSVEHGSPTQPRVPEGWILHAADVASARTQPMIQTLEEEPADGAGWRRPTEWGRNPVIESATADGDLSPRGYRRIGSGEHGAKADHRDRWIEEYDLLDLMGLGIL